MFTSATRVGQAVVAPPDESTGAIMHGAAPDERWAEGCPGVDADDVDDGCEGLAVAPWQTLAGIAGAVPGGDLALVLDLVDPTSLDDPTLVETVAAWEKLAAWAHLGAALAAGELSRRPAMNPAWTAPVPANTCVAGDELAMRLAWSKPAANRLVRDGRALDNELLLVTAAVRAGVLDTPKLRTLTDRLAGRPGQVAWAVQEEVLPAAATRTPGQLAADVDRALLTVEPADAADRLARATATRRVCRPKRLPDGMAGIWAVLPADDAVLVDTTLDATARTARAAGDSRTLDQLRADTLTALATGRALLAGTAAAGPDDLPTTTGARPSASAGGAHTAGSSHDDNSRAGRCDEGGNHEPRPRQASPATGRERPDHTAAGDVLASAPAPSGCPPVRIPRVRINVTVALSTLMGLDDVPAELAGFGPISAAQARALAAGGVGAAWSPTLSPARCWTSDAPGTDHLARSPSTSSPATGAAPPRAAACPRTAATWTTAPSTTACPPTAHPRPAPRRPTTSARCPTAATG